MTVPASKLAGDPRRQHGRATDAAGPTAIKRNRLATDATTTAELSGRNGCSCRGAERYSRRCLGIHHDHPGDHLPGDGSVQHETFRALPCLSVHWAGDLLVLPRTGLGCPDSWLDRWRGRIPGTARLLDFEHREGIAGKRFQAA